MAIDFDTTGWAVSQRLPEGVYPAVLLQVVDKLSSSGNPMLVWTFCLVDCDFTGKEFNFYTIKDPEQAWKIDQVLKATGLGEVGKPINFDYDDYNNVLVRLALVDDEFQGIERSSIGRVLAPEGVPVGSKWEGAALSGTIDDTPPVDQDSPF